MLAIVMEWGSLLLRWVHMIAGIAWIGSSFYFMHIDAVLKPAPDLPRSEGGEAWEVHGGGFYQVRKWLVAPEHVPQQLIWHKWESYATWISGFFLLIWIYYIGAELYLIDPTVRAMSAPAAAAIGILGLTLGWVVYDTLCRSPLASSEVALAGVGFLFVVVMAWLFQQVFSGRGAMLHTGALMATIMTCNVLMVIIPNQRQVIADLLAAKAPDPALGKAGKTRSTHNNYLTLPVLFLMIAGHYPMVYGTPYAFVIVGLVLIAGALIRHFYNARHAGRGNLWWTWGVAAAAMLMALAISIVSTPGGRAQLGLRPTLKVKVATAIPPVRLPKDVDDIVTSRCSMCHAAEPVWSGIAAAPKGVRLDRPEDILRHAPEIRLQSVLTHAMPPNNVTAMTLAERNVLAAWLAHL